MKLLTPRDWHFIALQEAIKLVGTDEYEAKMVEARRYSALADCIDRLQARNQALESSLLQLLNKETA